ACPSRASNWPSLATPWGFPCCARSHLSGALPHAALLERIVYRLPPLPRCGGWASSSLKSSTRISLPRYDGRAGPHDFLFEVCSVFTRVAACTLALSPIRDTHYPKASAISLPP